jgi:hypothetical protein
MSEVPLFFARGMPPSSDERERWRERDRERKRESDINSNTLPIHAGYTVTSDNNTTIK